MLNPEDEWPVAGAKSISSNLIHKRAEAYLAELLMVNGMPELSKVDSFWQKPEHRKSYRGHIIILSNHIRYAGFGPVHRAIVKNNLSKIDPDMILKEMTEGENYE